MSTGLYQQTIVFGLPTETWAIVLATGLGPVLAILVTRWRDLVRDRRERQLRIFRTLLGTRRQAITPDHVNALNLIEIEFYGVQKVEKAWENYHAHLNASVQKPDLAERQKFENDRNDLLAKLLHAMASFLDYEMSEIDIRNGGYAPIGWTFRDDRIGAIQDFVADMGKGVRALPVFPFQAPPPAQAPKQTPPTAR